MRRRKVLALAPTLLPGCTAFGDGSPAREPASPTNRQPTATPTDTATATTEPTDTESPEPTPTEGPPPELIPAQPKSISATEVRDRLGGVSCDGLSTLPVVCGDGDDRIELSLSRDVAPLPTGTVEFTVRNRADERFQWNEYSWGLLKWDGRAWQWIAPTITPLELGRLEPGASHTYEITADNTTFHGTEFYQERSDVTLSGLGPGVYGFAVEGSFESAPDDEFEVGTVFGFAGGGPPVRPTDAVVDVGWEGDGLVVRTGADEREEELVVSFVDGGVDATLLPEHVRQIPGLRNTLSYAATEGVRSIRYRAGFGATPTALTYLDVVTPEGTDRYGFRDYVFEVTSERV